ncbi:MAG: hydantoinase/oxoprolinase family protein [Methanobacteriota archaeon]
MRIAAYDIGGANTKKLLLDTKTGKIKSEIVYFPVWKKKAGLKSFLQGIKEKTDCAAITMTAELCDCFSSKAEGVNYITSACKEVFENPYYLSVDKKLFGFGEIRNLKIAAANFAASIYFLEKKFGEGILIDVGSTTTDIMPFKRNKIFYCKTDLERLRKNQLIYTGMLRTPLSAIVSRVPFKNRLVRISSEHFAITADVYSILGMLKNYSCETPDGGGKMRKDSMRRIARLLCADLEELGKKEVLGICKYLHKKQVELIAKALRGAADDSGIKRAYVCGIGKELAKKACKLAGINAVDLSRITKAYDNLPCLGLAEMVKDYMGEENVCG